MATTRRKLPTPEAGRAIAALLRQRIAVLA
jgi:hypothetical protein